MTATVIPGQAPAVLTWRTARAGHGLIFYWHGGAYIEVHSNGHAIHAINVYDYAASAPRIAFNKGAMKAECKSWLAVTASWELDLYASA